VTDIEIFIDSYTIACTYIMCVYIFVCQDVCMYARMCVYLYIPHAWQLREGGVGRARLRMFTHTYVWIYNCMYTYRDVYTYTCVWMYKCMYTYVHTYVHICMFVCIRVFVFMYTARWAARRSRHRTWKTCGCLHIHFHIDIHMFTHICVCMYVCKCMYAYLCVQHAE